MFTSQLYELWEAMGFIRYPLTFSLFAVCALAVISFIKLVQPGAAPDLRTKTWIDAILFWGGFAVISGVLGTLVGMVVGAQTIEAAGEVSASLVWGGLKVSMLSSIFGVLILAGAAILWFTLQFRWRMLDADWREAA